MTPARGRGLILGAPNSGSGKTTLTLALLRALSRREPSAEGPVHGAKSGPDYIDPAFHTAACGLPCVNLDAWAMSPDRLKALAAGPGLLLIEGAMGLFDGAGLAGRGATADLSRLLGLPVVLIVDAARMAQSVAPLVEGFARHDSGVRIAGVILNRVGSQRHTAMLRAALAPSGLPVLGAVPRQTDLALPDRHLGLVQASEHPDLSGFLDRAADAAASHIDLDALAALASPLPAHAQPPPTLSPLGSRIAVARDAAFAFAYAHMLDAWHAAGASLHPFSPLSGQPVAPEVDAVLLPGGYPELHAGELAAMRGVWDSVTRAAERGATVYGECGGYMVLGQSLTDAQGHAHRMAGLLDLDTSFATRRLHLGYRQLATDHVPLAGAWAGHEFHYATTLSARGTALFSAADADGSVLPDMGLRAGTVCGSFAHLIDRASPGLSQTATAR
ncbi:MAG: cobyrinate a,c-diamide synthase [Rhodobacteraceae bacterium]|nr:cobyrinate a,c-diamide synthase [Paracoccaceae bacterium]